MEERREDIDLSRIPAGLGYSEWRTKMQPYHGRVVAVLSCALSEGGVSLPEEFYLVPCDFARFMQDPEREDGAVPDPTYAQRLVVRLQPPDPRKLPLVPIRVVGYLHVGKILDPPFVLAWGELTNARWEHLRQDSEAD